LLYLGGYFLVLVFDPEDGGSLFFRKIGELLPGLNSVGSQNIELAAYTAFCFFFDPEAGSTIFLRKVRIRLQEYTTSHPWTMGLAETCDLLLLDGYSTLKVEAASSSETLVNFYPGTQHSS
jgi:hypothetical protein